MSEVSPKKRSRKDMISNSDPRWCPGCGDYSVFKSFTNTLASLEKKHEDILIISGIGCSSRLPYYASTYGFHTVHGRAPSFAVGAKMSNPELSVWVVTGDGDALSIGGNHFMHLVRRNADINVLLFNNNIYGLTKGQASPTSAKGTVTKSSPYGSLEAPVNPLALAHAAGATFTSRVTDTNGKLMKAVFDEAAAHKGTSIIEILVNCPIFHDGVHHWMNQRGVKDEKSSILEHGKPIIFGAEKKKGLRLNGFKIEEVVIGENGVTEDDIIVHDETSAELSSMLANLKHPEFPVPLGVLRRTESIPYEQYAMDIEKDQVKKKGGHSISDLLTSGDTWQI